MSATILDLTRLRRLGVTSPEQLLFWMPARFRDFSSICERIELPFAPKARMLYRLVVVSPIQRKSGSMPPMSTMTVTDGHVYATLSVFGPNFDWRHLHPGDMFFAEASVSEFGRDNKLYLNSPELIPDSLVGRVVPVYRSVKGVISKERLGEQVAAAIRGHLDDAVRLLLKHFPGHLSIESIEQTLGLKAPLRKLLYACHNPKSVAQGEAALREMTRVAAYGVVYSARIALSRPPVKGTALLLNDKHLQSIEAAMPFALTSDQQAAVRDLVTDLRSPVPMNRLLSGDVGSGKSAAFLIPAIVAALGGAHVAILAPNQLVAQQLHDEASAAQRGACLPVTTLLVDAKTKPLQLDADKGVLLIGTTALVGRVKAARLRLDLLVCDEQHKFSREQRELMVSAHTNYLEATATCIPRTVALVTHGGMDLSLLRERPVERTVKTVLCHLSERRRLMDHSRNVIAGGGQIAVVYARVAKGSGEDEDERHNVVQAGALWEREFPGRVGVLHGRMSDEDKAAIIDGMKSGKFDILVSSTVIEVGVTLPRLRSILMFSAEMYGVAALHQMRGRLVRQGGIGYFFMIPSTAELDEDAAARLALLVEHSDGFTLAEMDMRLRGFGALDKEAQSGKSLTMFRDIKLTPSDLERVAA